MPTVSDVVRHADTGQLACRLRTDDIYPDLRFEDVLAAADPLNWPRCLPIFWTDVVDYGTDWAGWTRLVEHIQFGWLRLGVPLRMFKYVWPDSYLLIYERTTDGLPPDSYDKWVTVDDGYTWVIREGDGIRLRTLKVTAKAGLLASQQAWMWPMLGWSDRMSEHFHTAAMLTDPIPMVPSVAPVGVTNEHFKDALALWRTVDKFHTNWQEWGDGAVAWVESASMRLERITARLGGSL